MHEKQTRRASHVAVPLLGLATLVDIPCGPVVSSVAQRGMPSRCVVRHCLFFVLSTGLKEKDRSECTPQFPCPGSAYHMIIKISAVATSYSRGEREGGLCFFAYAFVVRHNEGFDGSYRS